MSVWGRDDLLRVLKLNENHHVGAWYRVKDDDVSVLVNCSDLFYWACGDAEPITPADLDDLEQALSELTALDAPYWAGELFVCRRRGMRPQGAWYGYGKHDDANHYEVIRRHFVPVAVEAIFDACGPERTDGDGPKSPRPADGRRWDYGSGMEHAPADFVDHFKPGGKFGP